MIHTFLYCLYLYLFFITQDESRDKIIIYRDTNFITSGVINKLKCVLFKKKKVFAKNSTFNFLSNTEWLFFYEVGDMTKVKFGVNLVRKAISNKSHSVY